MGLVDYYQVVVVPVDVFQIQTVGLSTGSGQIGVEEDVISQAVFGDGIVQIVAAVCYPVVVQFFGTEY